MGYTFVRDMEKEPPELNEMDKKMGLDEYDDFLDVSFCRGAIKRPDWESGCICVMKSEPTGNGGINIKAEKVYKSWNHLYMDGQDHLDHLIIHDIPSETETFYIEIGIVNAAKNITVIGDPTSLLVGGSFRDSSDRPMYHLENLWVFGNIENLVTPSVHVENLRPPVASLNEIRTFRGTRIIGLDDHLKNPGTTIISF